MNDHFLPSRRSVLLGLGSGLLLPWLSAPTWAADEEPKKTDDAKPGEPKEKTPEKVGANGKYHGYGSATTGGTGKKKVEVSSLKELKTALEEGDCHIIVKKDIKVPTRIQTSADNITLDGESKTTIWGDEITRRDLQMLSFRGKNIIVKDIHLRNGGDCLEFHGAKDVVVEHVSCTGAGDDGISFGYGAERCTITHCLVAGCTRGIFIKYEGTKHVTVDHTIIHKVHMRMPLLDNIDGFDVRNNLLMEWGVLGCRLSGTKCNGNVTGNIYIAKNKGLKVKAIVFGISDVEKQEEPEVGNIYIADNDFRGDCEEKTETKGTVDKALDAPAIVPAFTTDFAKLEKYLLSDTDGAGCMPRDALDKAYLENKASPPTAFRALRIDEKGKLLDDKKKKPK